MGLQPEDLVACEIEDGGVRVTRVEPFDAAYRAALSQTLDQWGAPEDEEAFRDLCPWSVVVGGTRPRR